MKVSVVIPAYNSAGVIGEALDSVAAQGRTDLEVIVVDDASKDRTCWVVESWRGRHPDIDCRLVRFEANQGPGAARNRGIDESSGEWIAFLDADDRWLPGRLDAQFSAAAAHPSAVMFCGKARRIGTADPGPSFAKVLDGKPKTGDGGVLTLKDFVFNNPVATSTVLARRDLLKAVGGFDPRFRGPEDLDLWLRVAARHEVHMLPEALAEYRVAPGSLSLDERRFLPEVLRVLAKAFGPGGALEGHPEWRETAESTQFWNASWMAFSRRDRLAAVLWWRESYRRDRRASARASRAWWRLLARYLVGPGP